MAGVKAREPVLSMMTRAEPRLDPVANLADTVQQMHQILDALPESVICIDRSWHCTFVNQAAQTILNADDLIGANLWTRFPKNREEPFASNFRATLEQRLPRDFEAHYPEPLDIWFKISTRPFDGGMIIFSSDITDRKRAEARRDTNARLLEQVLEATSDAVVSLDQHFNYSFLNRQAELLLGRDDLLGKNLWREFPSTEADSSLRRCMEERVGCEFEVFNPAPLNRWFRVQARPSEDGIVVFFHDVTEERATRQSLLAQQDTLAFVQQSARVATWEIDHATGRLTVSKGSFPVWGRPAEQVTTVGEFYALLHPDDRDTIMERHRVAALGRDLQAVDYRVLGPHGETIWLEGRVAAIRDESGVPIRIRGITMDITVRKDAEALRDANARLLEQVLEATSDGVVSLDRDWKIRFLNGHGMKLVGRSDLVGKNHWEEFPAAVSTGIYEHYQRTMNEQAPVSFETYYPEPLNRWFSVECRPSGDGIVVFFRDIDEERRSKQRLLDQQRTLAFVQEAARIATWTVDLTTEAMTIEEGSYPVFGRPNEEVCSMSDFRRIVVTDDLATVRAGVARAVQTGEVAAADYRVTVPDGGVIWLEGRCLPVFDGAGKVTHLRGMTTDITARKQNEEHLAASEAKYRVLTDLNPQSIWMADAEGRIIYANQEFVEYLGKPYEELLAGIAWLNGFDPLDRDRVMGHWLQCVTSGLDYEVEARIRRGSDGASRWWRLKASPVRDAEGRILSWLGVADDIQDARSAAEELKRKQEETEQQRAELEAIYENAPLGLALFDPVEFRWLRLNESQAEITGMCKQDLLGTRLFDLVKIPGVRELFERVSAGHAVLDQLVEGELPTRPGEKRVWRVNYLPIFAPDGSVQAITAASLEITREKKAEAALVQSEKLAAVGRLASSISHEINNPLEAITNLLYLMAADEQLHESVKVYVHLAQSELSRVSQIATQTLRFHRQAVKPTMVTAAELVSSVLGLYHGRLSNSNIRVEARYASKTRVLCFENDLRQVLNNLIANAIDAMRSGGRLLVRAHEATDWVSTAGLRKGVRITVADTGHGMPPAVRERIFEPFYTTKDLNGTGLGLWISSGIMQHHKGRLTVRSSQNPRHMGTVFTLFLPLGLDTAEMTTP